MSFVLKEDNLFTTRVTVHSPLTEGGKNRLVKWGFDATFKIITQADVAAAGGNVLEAALVSVSNVPLEDDISPERALEIIIGRGDTSGACMKAYQENVTKKNKVSNLGL